MKTSRSTSILGLTAALALAASALHAAAPAPKQKTAQLDAGSATAAPPFSYKPPLRGAPATRVGGGTRSLGARLMTLNVIAPNETGYTTRDKPTIYWYVSEALDKPVELAITSTASLQEASTPALEIMLKPPIEKGFHAVRLEDHGVALKPGVEYQWVVAVVGNSAQRSGDVIAGGSIKRVEGGAVLERLKLAPRAHWPALYAESGIWYDAIDDLSRLISAEPDNRRLREQRAALLEQVGLREAAEFDRAAER
ncbi:MAG TPA: DUF928 domain-containing protein [Burkholderiales bacterium]|nr:DUF928 domain-containing protein [Burkholderiales bacterium]